MFLGGIFIAVTLFLPRGVYGLFVRERNNAASRRDLFTRQLPGDRFRDQTDPVLQLESINVNFDGFQALTDLSLNIGVGELRCVIGPNGAGKTTLMDVITGKTRPQSGPGDLRSVDRFNGSRSGGDCTPGDRAQIP